jgi:hypothetical protein
MLGIATNPVELHASPSKVQESPVTLFRVSNAIGDYVWLDADRDGVQDVGERGIPNVKVALYSDPNGDGDPSDGSLVDTATTDATGRYLFPDLGSGSYVVGVTDECGALTGLSLTTASIDPHGPIDLGRGIRYLEADFGYAPSDPTRAAIGDTVWSDADDDGIQDPGEPGIGGVTVELLADSDSDGNFTELVATTTTADDGTYLFLDVDPGHYVVDVTDIAGLLVGYSLTTGPQSSPDPTAPIGVEAGDVYLNADFGYHKSGLGTIGNQVWLDEDQDGIYEPGASEDGFADVTLNLILDTDGDGAWDTDERVIASITAADGSYQFTGLSLDDGDGDADYLVEVTDLNDVLRRYRQSSTTFVDAADNHNRAQPYAVALSSGSSSDSLADFGYWFDQDEGLAGNQVWYDLDGDLVQDPEEPGVTGVTVELWRMKKQGQSWERDRKVGEVTTDVNGEYYYPHLEIGANQSTATRYQACVATSNFLPGGPLDGFAATNQPDDRDESELLHTDNAVDLTLDFGYRFELAAYSIGDYVWHDTNADGEQDGDESGLANVTLALYQDGDQDGEIDADEPLLATDTTDANGGYLFENLPDGDYAVAVTDENGVLVGYEQTAGSNPWSVPISGHSREDIDFGYVRNRETGRIGDTVWYDDGNGVQDAGEGGIADVIVTLRDAAGHLVGTTVTGADGTYFFGDLGAGVYFVHVDEGNFGSGQPLEGLSSTTGGETHGSVVLSEGNAYMLADFGYDPPGESTAVVVRHLSAGGGPDGRTMPRGLAFAAFCVGMMALTRYAGCWAPDRRYRSPLRRA